MAAMTQGMPQDERMVPLDGLGESLGLLRLRSPAALREIQQSLVRHGQMSAVMVYAAADGQVEIVDGFKRLHAARELGWPALRVRVLELEPVQAKAAIGVLNRPAGLTEVEEGWLVRSLYREDGLTQPQIGQLLSRHKSWVCRRLMLAEGLVDAVQMDVRLGLLAARTACALSRLPRGNQQEVADLVARRGLTTTQTDRLVRALVAAPDEAARRRLLADLAEGSGAGPARAGKATDRPRSPTELLMADIEAVTRIAARLQARLLAQPLCVFGKPVTTTICRALCGLVPVLVALQRTAQEALHEESHALPDEPRRADP
jgi:ParB-like chromosome segregation protein Spo0J